LFHAAAAPGLSPSEPSPRRDRVPLSRPLAPLQSSTDPRAATLTRTYRPRFPRRPRSHAVAWFPRRLWVPFSRALTRFPVALSRAWLRRPLGQLHLLRSLAPSANPFAPARVAPHQRSLLSWAFAPSETPIEPRRLEPARTRKPVHRLHPEAPARDDEDRSPRHQVKSSLATSNARRLRRQSPVPFETGPHRLSAATPSLSALPVRPRRSARPGPQSF